MSCCGGSGGGDNCDTGCQEECQEQDPCCDDPMADPCYRSMACHHMRREASIPVCCRCPVNCCSCGCCNDGMPTGNCSDYNNSRSCCRPRWNASMVPGCSDCLPMTFERSLCFPCLPPVSNRYFSWINSIAPVVDSNLCPSRISSQIANDNCEIDTTRIMITNGPCTEGLPCCRDLCLPPPWKLGFKHMPKLFSANFD